MEENTRSVNPHSLHRIKEQTERDRDRDRDRERERQRERQQRKEGRKLEEKLGRLEEKLDYHSIHSWGRLPRKWRLYPAFAVVDAGKMVTVVTIKALVVVNLEKLLVADVEKSAIVV